MGTSVMIIIIFIFLLMGVPIGISIGTGILILLAINPITPLEFIAQSLYSGLESTSLIALPFFMIAGTIMEAGGISRRLVSAANSVVGNITGSLGIVAIISCIFFGAVSGSAIATVAAIGSIMLPAMVKEGYDKKYATGLIAVSGSLGMIIPPSTPMVVYGVTNNVSIGALFIAGLLPGLLVGFILIIINYFISKNYGYIPKNTYKITIKSISKAFWDAKWALMMPVIILGGIYSGTLTPTEAAVISCVYGMLVGIYINKELTWYKIWLLYKNNTSFIGGLLFTFAPAAALSAIFAYLKVPEMITLFFKGISSNPNVILFLILILLIIIGMFLQTTPAIILITPILFPVVLSYGINPIHFGIFVTVTLTIGLITPPVAMNLFVSQSMTGISMLDIAKAAIPFVIALLIAVLIIMLIPEISLFLPKLFGFI